MAAVLQRSVTSFRRQGSSGLVWDDRFFSGEVNLIMKKPYEEDQEDDTDNKHIVGLRQSHSDGSIRMVWHPTRIGARDPLRPLYQTSTVLPESTAKPPTPPPSPRIGGCGFCGIFSRSVAKKTKQTTSSSNKFKS